MPEGLTGPYDFFDNRISYQFTEEFQVMKTVNKIRKGTPSSFLCSQIAQNLDKLKF